jgi:hypothetical protein
MGDEVDQALGGSADGLKHDHGVGDGDAGDEIAELRAAGDGHWWRACACLGDVAAGRHGLRARFQISEG